MTQWSNGMIAESVSVVIGDDGLAAVSVGGWRAMRLDGLSSAVLLERGAARCERRDILRRAADDVEIIEIFDPGIELRRRWRIGPRGVVILDAELTNKSGASVDVDDIRLLRAAGDAPIASGAGSAKVYEQGSYWARVRPWGAPGVSAGGSGEQNPAQAVSATGSQNVWLTYDSDVRMALLIGCETGERSTGSIHTAWRGTNLMEWSVGMSCGRTTIRPGQCWPLATVTIAAGSDPWQLLCEYGDRVRARHQPRILARPPVSWCSWYPFRLGVTEQRVLANARIAAERLVALGHEYMLLDLGWQSRWLPSSFEENDQFPSGLRALADQLRGFGLRLGAWCAPFTISEHDPLVTEHPEWLLGSEGDHAAKPQPTGEWFWEPHGKTFALDLTHPSAQEWLRARIRSLAERGVRYLKPDFMGGIMAGNLTDRADRSITAGGGAEAARIGMAILHEEMTRPDPGALVLNCSGPELPGKGCVPLLYTCDDTGNTGYVGWKHLENDYGRNVAGHLWKNGRWGIIQPSCLVVGLPGGIEEARTRATATFLAGGQVDIGDDLTTLPEDRWHVLLSTLPPIGVSATPVDLFEPLETATLGYDASASGRGGDAPRTSSEGVSRVWTLPIRADWDAWTLVGVFNYDTNDDAPYGKAEITRIRLPVQRLGLDPNAEMSVFEFWSGQYLGHSPFVHQNPKGYKHPGDSQKLISSPGEGIWEVSFFGPGVKLLVVRPHRQHPWPAAATFHQSGGVELEDVRWGGSRLSGSLRRNRGETGLLVIAADGWQATDARVNGKRTAARSGATGSVVVPITCDGGVTRWDVRFKKR